MKPVVATTAGTARGIALLAVLVVLAILMGLLAPFLLSMTHEQAHMALHVDRTSTDLMVASGVDAVLLRGGQVHKAVDPTPSADGPVETQLRFTPPEAFAALADGKSRLLTAEAEDEQRRANLHSITPLLLGNLLDLATFTSGKTAKDGKELMVGDTSGFPDTGYLVVDGELIHYGAKQGNAFTNLDRGLLSVEKDPDSAFAPAHDIDTDLLVVDMRVRLAVTWPFDEGGNGRRSLTPWRSLDELMRIGELPFGPFTREMIDRLRPNVTVWSTRLGGGAWLNPERIFTDLTGGSSRTLLVRSGEFLGPGTVVRITGDGQEEYALVRRAEPAPQASREVTLSSKWQLTLERPVVSSYRQTYAFVQALAPHPVNCNTASVELLTAILRGIQQRPGIQRDGHPVTITPLPRSQAEELAKGLVALRDTPDAEGHKLLLSGWEDLIDRWIKPQLASDQLRNNQLFNVYRNILNARNAGPAMGTAPLCFTSDPVFRYRSAAAVLSGTGVERARREVQGVAHVIPGGELLKTLTVQDQFEEELRLLRDSPWWMTGPNNTGSSPGGAGSNPVDRALAHLLPVLHNLPARFPTKDPQESFIQARPANLRLQPLPGAEYHYQDFFSSPHSDGRDLSKEGPYEITETGKGRAQGGQARQGGGGGDGKGAFGFADSLGLVRPFAQSFWWRLKDQSEQTVFDLGGSDDTRNRMTLLVKDGKLQYLVYDAAGQDPDNPSQPTGGQWEVPFTDLRVQGDQWLHINAHSDGTRPDQMALLTDGALKGKARYRTWLTQQVASWRPNGDRFSDKGRYPTLAVESTEGFPDYGVLRIGTELFEYTSKNGNTFVCDRLNSRGGRGVRIAIGEFNLARMTGTPVTEDQLQAGDEAPSHAPGSAVELYGYSAPFLAGTSVPSGGGRLPAALGPWGVARLVNGPSDIVVAIQNRAEYFGRGIDERYSGDLELAAPIPAQPGNGGGGGSGQGTDFMRPFVATGGYALLVQHGDRYDLEPQQQGGLTQSIVVGGVEVIRYSNVAGNKLKGVQRGLTLKPDLDPQNARFQYFTGQPHKFVTEWRDGIFVDNGRPIRDLWKYPQLLCYVVPISIPAAGNEPDPSRSGYAEWVQLYPGKDNEADTEWVRYDTITDRQLVRSRSAAVRQLYRALHGSDAFQTFRSQGGGFTRPPWLLENFTYPQPTRFPYKEIGYPDEFEFGGSSSNATGNLPHYAARVALRFRGDPETGTSSHAQNASAMVLPVMRMELRRQQYPAAVSPRLGRDDRIAFVPGSKDDSLASVPPEWHTANWVVRRFRDDNDDRDQGGNVLPPQGRDLGGPHCQLIGLKAALTFPQFLGRAPNENFVDVRRFDRALKFPSGELPSVAGTAAYLGGRKGSRAAPARGFVDELSLQTRILPHVQATEPSSWFLSGPMAEGAGTLTVAEFALRAPHGLRGKNGGGAVAPVLKQGGGLLLIDGELIAYDTVDGNGTITIAQDGRALLGTQRRAHDEGAAVSFVDEVPCSILTEGMTASSSTAAVKSVGGFPPAEGTFLVGQELCHYAWSRISPDGPGMFEMPERRTDGKAEGSGRSDSAESRRTAGLFRGRYGSTPGGHGAGTPLLFFPIRYWDRMREQADDPELGYYCAHLNEPDLFLTGIYWEDETFDATCKPEALLRIDQQGPWSAVPTEVGDKSEVKVPDAVPWLLRLRKGKVDDKPNRLALQGSAFELRLQNVYLAGAFDPVLFNAPGWKTAPRLRNVALQFLGETRILEQRESAR